MKLRLLLRVFCILTFTLLGSRVADAMELNLNLHTGEKYNVHTVSTVEAAVTVEIVNISTAFGLDMNLSMDVVDVDKDKNTTLYYGFKSINAVVAAPGKELKFDPGQNSVSNSLNSVLGSMLGKGFTVKVDKKGRVLQVQGVAEIVKGLIDSMPGDEKNPFRKLMVESFSDNALNTMLKNSTGYLAEKSIRKGDTWEEIDVIKSAFPMTIKDTWQLTGEKNGILHIDTRTTIATGSEAADEKSQTFGMPVIRVNGSGSGSIDVNKYTGLALKESQVEKIDIEIELPDPKKPEKMKIPVTVTIKSTSEVTKFQ
ncbi:MAG: hypothetical protein H6Q67_650 [Firmicutes bacterium]|nr:hypothetical protein [Bacillota bacterium]